MKNTSLRIQTSTRGHFLRTLPSPGATTPRDSKRIDQTEDLLFIAGLLHEARADGVVIESIDAQENWHYYPENFGSRRGTDVSQLQKKSEISVETVWRDFREDYLSQRRYISSTSIFGHGFKIGRLTIRPEPERSHRSLWKFGAGLRRPFYPDNDPLWERFPENVFFDREGTTPPSTIQFPFYCPFDGPVKMSLVEPARPLGERGRPSMRTWSAWVCPRCLGLFHYCPPPPISRRIRFNPKDYPSSDPIEF